MSFDRDDIEQEAALLALERGEDAAALINLAGSRLAAAHRRELGRGQYEEVGAAADLTGRREDSTPLRVRDASEKAKDMGRRGGLARAARHDMRAVGAVGGAARSATYDAARCMLVELVLSNQGQYSLNRLAAHCGCSRNLIRNALRMYLPQRAWLQRG